MGLGNHEVVKINLFQVESKMKDDAQILNGFRNN